MRVRVSERNSFALSDHSPNPFGSKLKLSFRASAVARTGGTVRYASGNLAMIIGGQWK